jgi:hypothetical protein
LIAACLLGAGLAAPASAQDAEFGSFEDVPMEHWAFLTVETLVRKYKVMAGFPDGSFGGAREVSRYELAAALDKVLERMAARTPGLAPPKTDVEAVKAVAGELDLTGLTARVAAFEEALAKATNVGPAAVKIGGGIGTTWMDNTQDNVNPYLKTGLGLDFNGRVSDWEFAASMYGDVPGSTVGNKPGTAGGDKPPENAWHFGGANVSTSIAGTQFKLGMFSPDAYFGAGSDVPSKFGGIVGNGFVDPWVSSVRWGDRNAALAATREFGPVGVSAAVTPTVVLVGLNAKIAEWLVVKATADTDQPDWWGVTPNRTTARNLTGVVDIGNGPLAGSVAANLAKELITASAQVTWAIVGDVRLSAAAVYRESEGAVTEVTPGVSLYLPSFAPPYAPTLLIGVKEPQGVSAADETVVPGPGSLLGEQAGVSAVFDWKLEDAGLPNIKAEYNIQQPVLFYSIYDATFAVSAGRGF